MSHRALLLDPFSLGQNYCVGRFLYSARKYDEAIEHFRQALELDSNFPPSHLGLAYAYEQEEAYDEAVSENQKALSLLGFEAEKIAACKEAYVACGWTSYWQKRLDLAEEQSQHRYVSAYSIAEKYLRLGEKDTALEHLEKAYEQRDPSLIVLGVEPLWDVIRSDRRFHDLLCRMCLEP